MTDTDPRPYARDPRAEAKAAKAYAKATRPWYRKKRFWLLGFIAFVVLFTLIGGGDDETDTATTPATDTTTSAAVAPAAPAVTDTPTATAEATTTEPAPPPVEEPALTVTAQQMIEDLESNALGASNTYKDKRVIVTGKVGTIDASGDYFTIKGTDEYSFTNVMVKIEEEHLAQVGAFSEGQDVTVTGTVSGVGEVLGYTIEAETIG